MSFHQQCSARQLVNKNHYNWQNSPHHFPHTLHLNMLYKKLSRDVEWRQLHVLHLHARKYRQVMGWWRGGVRVCGSATFWPQLPSGGGNHVDWSLSCLGWPPLPDVVQDLMTLARCPSLASLSTSSLIERMLVTCLMTSANLRSKCRPWFFCRRCKKHRTTSHWHSSTRLGFCRVHRSLKTRTKARTMINSSRVTMNRLSVWRTSHKTSTNSSPATWESVWKLEAR